MQNLKDVFSDDQPSHYTLNSYARPGFVRKVYGILSFQLTATFLMTFMTMSSLAFQNFMINHLGILYFALTITIILPIALICNRQLARQVPTNYIILALFTLGESYLVSFTCLMYEPDTVCMAALLTLGITFSLTFYAMTTKSDLTYAGGLLFMLASGLFFAGLARIFIRSEFLEILIALGGAILYGFYIIYDTQLIIGGKRGALEIDDYIFGALMLYLDVVVLFIKILKLLDKLKDDDKKKNRR